ncbi:MAG TPA: hypothetical protein VMT18_09305 [Planctomycetota bacterium]|nr:hypothetical protein [Planctomycetota bacterium]
MDARSRSESEVVDARPGTDAAQQIPALTVRRGERAADWRAILAAASPREVLARLMNADPLGLARVVEERLRARAYLLDADRVFLRAAARCARLAGRYRGDPPLSAWLAERVDESLLELIDEELESLASGADPAGDLRVFESLAAPLGLDPARTRRACAVHNALDEAERRAFREVVLEGRDLDELARGGGRSATAIARSARRALLAVLAEIEAGGAS